MELHRNVEAFLRNLPCISAFVFSVIYSPCFGMNGPQWQEEGAPCAQCALVTPPWIPVMSGFVPFDPLDPFNHFNQTLEFYEYALWSSTRFIRLDSKIARLVDTEEALMMNRDQMLQQDQTTQNLHRKKRTRAER